MLRLALHLIPTLMGLAVIRAEPVHIHIPPLNTSEDYLPLQHYLCEGTQLQPNTTIVLSPDVTHTITPGDLCEVSDVWNLTLQGGSGVEEDTDKLARVQCTNWTRGIGFRNVTSLKLRNIAFLNCGESFVEQIDISVGNDAPFRFDKGQKTTLLLDHCLDVTVSNVHIESYSGFAIVGINIMSHGYFERVILNNSGLPPLLECQYNSNCTIGGGLLFYYTDTAAVQTYVRQDTTLTIFQCVYTGNKNNAPSDSNHQVLKRQLELNQTSSLPAVGASSMTVLLTQTLFTVNVSVHECTFTENNAGVDSFGAMLAVFLCPLDKGYIQITSTHFLNNNYQFAPGKIEGHDLNVFVKPTHLSGNVSSPQVTIVNSNFTYLTEWRPPTTTSIHVLAFTNVVDLSTNFIILLDSVRFQSNTGNIYVSALPQTTTAKYMDVILKDIISIEGFAGGTHGVFEFRSIGQVTAEGTDPQKNYYYKTGGCTFYMISCDLHMSGFIHVNNSDGVNGAVVLMEAGSHLVFHEPLSALLGHNHAVHGSGVYGIQPSDTLCTFQYVTQATYTVENITNVNITVELVGNEANIAGNSIYAFPIYFCELYTHTNVKIDTTSSASTALLIYESIFKSSKSLSSEMSSLPTSICTCNYTSGDTLVCGGFVFAEDLITIHPGQSLSIGIMTVDGNNQAISSQIVSLVLSIGEREIETWTLAAHQETVQLLDGTCSQVNYTIYTTNPVDLSTGNYLALIYTSYSRIGNGFVTYIDMQVCPPGFQESDEGFCDCIPLLAGKGLQCDIDAITITRLPNSWIGLIDPEAEQNTSQFFPKQYTSDVEVGFAPRCPYGYCKFDADTVDFSENPDNLCVGSRSGLVCGACAQNKSVVFGSEECRNCSNWWIFTLFLMALAGILLVVLLFSLRLTVSYGTINGLVFYANVLGIHLNHLLPFHGLQWLRIFVSFVNLDLGFPLCFYNGMDQLAKTGLQFAFPLYLWTIVIAIIAVSRYSIKVAKYTSRWSVPVLATLIHLSYSKLLSTVLTIFAYTTVEYGHARSSQYGVKIVWFSDGNVAYNSGWHILLTLLSIVTVLAFLIPYTVALSSTSYFLRFRIVNYWRPFIDSYHGPYKDKWRFWFGARLWLVLSVYLINAAFHGINVRLTFFLQVFLIVGFTFVQIHIKPFRNKFVRFLDLSFLVNYLVITLCGVYFSTNKQTTLFVVSGIFVTIAFATFLGIIVHHLLKVLDVYHRIRARNRSPIQANISEYNIVVGAEQPTSPHQVSFTSQEIALSGHHIHVRTNDDTRDNELRESLLNYIPP